MSDAGKQIIDKWLAMEDEVEVMLTGREAYELLSRVGVLGTSGPGCVDDPYATNAVEKIKGALCDAHPWFLDHYRKLESDARIL